MGGNRTRGGRNAVGWWDEVCVRGGGGGGACVWGQWRVWGEVRRHEVRGHEVRRHEVRRHEVGVTRPTWMTPSM